MSTENDNLSTQYPRLIELCREGKQSNLASFFEKVENECCSLESLYANQLKEYERVLACLDEDAWTNMKNRVLSKSNGRADALYGYAQISDCLNEAYGYEFLKKQGYTDVKFIPEEQKQGTKTPELYALSDGETVAVLEVKTIRQSKEEMEYYANQAAKVKDGPLAPEDMRIITHTYDSKVVLPVLFKEKLTKVIEVARAQLEAQFQKNVRRIAYLLIELDGNLLTGTPYDKGIADKIGSFLRELSDDKVEIQYRFVVAFSRSVQKYNE